MLTAREAHKLKMKESIEPDSSLIAIELRIRKACKNEKNKCIIKEDEMTDRAYTILADEGYRIRWYLPDSTYEIYW